MIQIFRLKLMIHSTKIFEFFFVNFQLYFSLFCRFSRIFTYFRFGKRLKNFNKQSFYGFFFCEVLQRSLEFMKITKILQNIIKRYFFLFCIFCNIKFSWRKISFFFLYLQILSDMFVLRMCFLSLFSIFLFQF